MARYILGEDPGSREVSAGGSLHGDYDLEVEILTSFVRDSRAGAVFNITLGGSIGATPATDGSRVYFGACDRNFYAVDLETGREIWRFPTQGPIVSGACLDRDRIYTGSYDGNLYCLSREGRLVWKFPAGDRIASIPALSRDRIYFGCLDGNVYALERDGSLAWRYPTGGPIGSHVVAYKGRVYAGSFDRNIYALSLDGSLAWKFAARDHIGAPVARDDVIYFGSFDGCLYAVDTRGRLLWRFEAGDPIPVATNISVKDDTAFFGTRGNNLFAVRRGRLLWRFRTGNMIFSRPVIEEGRVYFGSSDGNLYALDEKTGRELWRFCAGGPVLYIAKSGERIIFGCYDCNLYAIDTKGNLLWKFHTSLDYPATIEFEPETQHAVYIPAPRTGRREPKAGTGEGTPREYEGLRGSYLGDDMRNYVALPVEGGVPGIIYRGGRKAYRRR
jgi:outer membrane protein assembly factor BamB